MDNNLLMDKLKEIINSVLKNKSLNELKLLELSKNLRDDLGMDSLDLAELTVKIEDEFNVDIFEDGIVNTIGEIVNKLNGK